MCGIVGMYNNADERMLVEMLNSTEHRGEDNTRYRMFDNRCGLGINRLSIVDLERGDQPLDNEDGSIHVVCNAVTSDLVRPARASRRERGLLSGKSTPDRRKSIVARTIPGRNRGIGGS